MEERRNVRLHAHRVCVQTEQQVVHRGVAGEAHAVNAVGREIRASAHFLNQRAEGFVDHGLLQPRAAALLAGFDDAVDHVRAVADLAVAGARLGQNIAVFHIYQQRGDRRGAQVDHEAGDRRFVRAGQHVQHANGIALGFENGAHVKRVLAQHAGQLFERRIRDHDRLRARFLAQLPRQTLVVRHRVVHRRLGQLHAHAA